jgi:hypothetical protein
MIFSCRMIYKPAGNNASQSSLYVQAYFFNIPLRVPLDLSTLPCSYDMNNLTHEGTC